MEITMTKEEAVFIEKKMWEDMKRSLGDCPSFIERCHFLKKWYKENFNKQVNLFYERTLCRWSLGVSPSGRQCVCCPVNWNKIAKIIPTMSDLYWEWEHDIPYDTPDRRCNCTDTYKNGYRDQSVYGYAPISEILELLEEASEV